MNHQRSLSPAEAYDSYLGPAMFVPCARLLLNEAAPRSGETAVDVACGTGIVTRHLTPLLGESGAVTGVDFSPDMLAVARNQPAVDGARIAWREGSADDLPLEDDAADLVVCQQGFQFFPNRPAAAREMRRVLNGDGRAVIAVWRSLDHHDVFRALMEAEADHLGVPVATLAVPFSCGDVDALRNVLAEAGFRDIRIREESFTAELPDPDRFIELAVMAGAAVLPELSEDDPAARKALLKAVTDAASDTVRRHHDGDQLKFPMHTYIATGTV